MKRDQTFNVRKTAAMTSLTTFLWFALFITGYILLYTKLNAVIPELLLLACFAISPIMLYYVWKFEKWINEKEEDESNG